MRSNRTIIGRWAALFALAVAAGPATASPPASAWQIGPIIDGRNYSERMPLHPTPAENGWTFDFPYPDRGAGNVHYVTFDHGSLTGKSEITVRYRVEAKRGAMFVPTELAQMPATVSLYFQRRGDNWRAKGRYEHYRWYAPGGAVDVIAPGVHEMTVSLTDGKWSSVQGKSAAANPQAFAAAIREAERVGLLFGTMRRRGHGVFATAPARFTLIDFEIR